MGVPLYNLFQCVVHVLSAVFHVLAFFYFLGVLCFVGMLVVVLVVLGLERFCGFLGFIGARFLLVGL